MGTIRTQWFLFIIFAVSLLAALICVVISGSRGEISSDTLQSLLGTLLSAYSVPFAVIAGGVCSHQIWAVDTNAPFFAVVAALCLYVVWNLVLLLAPVSLLFEVSYNAKDFASHVDSVSKIGNWIIAGALSFFFAIHAVSGNH